MAEILFLICLTILLLGLHVILGKLFKRIFQFPFWMFLIGSAAILILGLNILGICILAVCLIGILLFFRRDKEFPLVTVVGIILIMVLLMVLQYPLWGEKIHSLYFNYIDRFMNDYPEMSRSRIIDALFSIWVYHEYIPGIIGVVTFSSIYTAWNEEEYPFTFWMRYTNNFSHLWLIPAMLTLMTAFLFSQFNGKEQIQMVLSNISLVAAAPLMLLGYLIIIFGLKRKKVPEMLAILALYSALVFSGPYFLFVLVLFFGIGISDSWMHYLKKA